MIVKDATILNELCKKYGMTKDREYDYIIDEGNPPSIMGYKDKSYKLTYISGCFYPYIEEVQIH